MTSGGGSCLESIPSQALAGEIARHWPTRGPNKGFSCSWWAALLVSLSPVSVRPGWSENESLWVWHGDSPLTFTLYSWGGPQDGSPGNHHYGPGRSQCSEGRTWQTILHVTCWTWWGTRTTRKRQTVLSWSGAKRTHFFLWSFIIFHFGLAISPVTAFHCLYSPLLKSFTHLHLPF